MSEPNSKLLSSQKWIHALSVHDLEEGEVAAVELEGVELAIYRVNSEFYATSNICTHALACLSDGWLEDHVIECPLHGGKFDIRNGLGLGAPITENVRVYQVTRVIDDLFVALNK